MMIRYNFRPKVPTHEQEMLTAAQHLLEGLAQELVVQDDGTVSLVFQAQFMADGSHKTELEVALMDRSRLHLVLTRPAQVKEVSDG